MQDQKSFVDNSELLEEVSEKAKEVFRSLLEGQVHVVELAKKLGLPIDKVSRILKLLERYGVAIRQSDRSYVPWNWPLPERLEQEISQIQREFLPITLAEVAIRVGRIPEDP